MEIEDLESKLEAMMLLGKDSTRAACALLISRRLEQLTLSINALAQIQGESKGYHSL